MEILSPKLWFACTYVFFAVFFAIPGNNMWFSASSLLHHPKRNRVIVPWISAVLSNFVATS
jgi:hypothetical protein